MKNKIIIFLGLSCLICFFVSVIIDICLFCLQGINSFSLRTIEAILAALSSSLSLSYTIRINSKKQKNVAKSKDSSVAQLTIGDNSNVGDVILSPNNNEGLRNELTAIEADIDVLKKENMDSICDTVFEKLKNEVISQPIDKDFLIKYINDGSTITDKDIQSIWADLLVSKVTGKTSTTKRLLSIVKDLSSQEALIFEKVANLSAFDGTIFDYFKKQIPFSELSILVDIGLIKSHDFLNEELHFSEAVPKIIVARNSNLIIVGEYKGQTTHELSLSCCALTEEGKLLKSALDLELSNDNLIALANDIKSQNKVKELNFSVHTILRINNGNVNYLEDDLLEGNRQ